LVRGMGYNVLPGGGENAHLYKLERNKGILRGLENRLIIEWQSTRNWIQDVLEKEVLEIRPPGFVREFTGYMDFTLSFEELRKIVGWPGAAKPQSKSENTEEEKWSEPGDPVWKDRLSSVSGVYVIHANDGSLYVGAAYGKKQSGGFLGRWRGYAQTNDFSQGESDKTGLRENTGLKAFLDKSPDKTEQQARLHDLQFSILRTMDKSSRDSEVLDMEKWFKEKLGSRVKAKLGLNDN
jgi:hypothetical protein